MFGKTTRHRPEELKSLERSTKFTRKEIQLIYRGFKQVFLFSIWLLYFQIFILFPPSFIRTRLISSSFISTHFLFCVCESGGRLAGCIIMKNDFLGKRNIFLAFRGTFRSTESMRALSFLFVVMILQLAAFSRRIFCVCSISVPFPCWIDASEK